MHIKLSQKLKTGYFCFNMAKEGYPKKSHKTAYFFRTGGEGGAQPHFIAFGGVFPNITEAILVVEISTKVRIYPPKVIT